MDWFPLLGSESYTQKKLAQTTLTVPPPHNAYSIATATELEALGLIKYLSKLTIKKDRLHLLKICATMDCQSSDFMNVIILHL